MRRSKLMVSVLAVGLMALTGCGSDSLDTGEEKGGDVKTSVDKDAAAMVPAEIKDKGTLMVGTDATYPPSEFVAADGKTIQGFDVDLLNAVAKKLDLKVKLVPSKFDSIITGVEGGKYDMGMSSFSINPERLKQATMVSYYRGRHPVGQRPGQPEEGRSAEALRRDCGRAEGHHPAGNRSAAEDRGLQEGRKPDARPADL